MTLKYKVKDELGKGSNFIVRLCDFKILILIELISNVTGNFEFSNNDLKVKVLLFLTKTCLHSYLFYA